MPHVAAPFLASQELSWLSGREGTPLELARLVPEWLQPCRPARRRHSRFFADRGRRRHGARDGGRPERPAAHRLRSDQTRIARASELAAWTYTLESSCKEMRTCAVLLVAVAWQSL